MEHMSMLNVLAEIASEKLQTDPAVIMITKAEKQKNSLRMKAFSSQPTQNQGKQMTLVQVSTLSESSILRLFTVSQANELKRKFYFTCRLIPLQCEETFHSFGSEDKARNLMKKHLKKHLHDLLEKFIDPKTQENYILHTVEKSRGVSQNDFKSSSKKQYSTNKSEIKSKFINEKENSSVDITAKNGKGQITYSKSSISSSSSSDISYSRVSMQSHIPSLASESSVQMSFGSKNPLSISEDKMSVSSSKCTPVYVGSLLDRKNEERNLNKQSATSVKRRQTINASTTTNENTLPQKIDKCKEVFKIHTTPIHSGSDLAISHMKPCSKEQNVPSVTYSIDGNGEISFSQLKVHHANIGSSSNVDSQLHKKCNPIINHAGVVETVFTKATEVIEIKMEETIKLEVLDLDQQYKMTTNVSHDHGYMVNEENLTHFQVEKEEIVVSSDHSQHQEFILGSTHHPSSPTRDTSHDDADNKSRTKGKGKFIGQSKGEKEMALTLIDKFKSQPVVQVENFQCNICKPPRVFTAHSTLVSHYKSHAGIRPYVCSLCQAVFTRQHSLNYHLLIHSNQTRFTCDDCGRKFRHPSHFKEHRRRHTGESPYECTDCLMRFKTRNTYKRHLRTRHGKKLTTKGSIHSVTEDAGAAKISLKTSSNPPTSQEFQSSQKTTEEKLKKVTSADSQQTISSDSATHVQMNYTEVTERILNQDNDFCHHHGNIEYPEMIPFNSEIGVYTTAKAPSEDGCFHVSDKRSDPTVLPSKQYHELMPLEVPQISSSDDSNVWSVVGFSQSSPSNGEVATYADNSASTPSSQVLHDIQGNDNSVPTVSLQQAEQQRNSTINLRNTGDSILFIISDGAPVNTHVDNVTPNGLVVSRAVNNSKKVVSTPAVNDKNEKKQSGKISPTPRQNLDTRPAAKGSILNSLLTSGPGRGRFTSQPSFQSASLKVERETPLISNKDPGEQTDGADKWDRLMREVVSLSSAVKLRPDPTQQSLSSEIGNVTFVRNHLNDKDITMPTRDTKEVYVLKYVNGAAGNSVAKVFKAKPLFGGMIPVGDSNSPKPILITSSFKNCGKVGGSAPSAPVEALR